MRQSISIHHYIQEHRAFPLPTDGLEMYQPPLYYLIGAAALSACKLSINDPQSVVVLRLLGRIFRHCTIRFGLFEFAAAATGASGVHRTFTGGVSADAFVPRRST